MSDAFATKPTPGLLAGRLGDGPFGSALRLVAIGAGAGLFAALILYGTKAVLLWLVIAGLLVLIPTFIVRDHRLYWLALFFLVIQFEIKKNLNDGLAIVRDFHIDYTLYNFTFEVRGSDLVFLMLAFFWIHDIVFHGRRLRLPRATWLAVIYLGICVLSLFGARWPYLGIVEIVRQMRFVIFFLYAYNNLCSPKALRLIAAAAIAILVFQGAVTAGRYGFGFYETLAFGVDHQDEQERDKYLQIDRESGNSTRRAFGTGLAPGSTGKLCLMLIPFALLCCLPNPLLRRQGIIIVLFAASGAALLLTYTRSFFLAAGVELLAGFLIAVWRGYLPRTGALVILALALVGAAAVAPKVSEMFHYRKNSYTVRFAQYESSYAQIKAHPLLGLGINNGTGLKREYVRTSYNEVDPNTQSYAEPTHNLYLALAADIGIPGAILFFAFFGIVIRTAWRLSATSRDPTTAFFASAVLIVFVGVATSAMGDPFHEDATLALAWMYSGVILGLSDAERASRRSVAVA